MCYVGVYDAIAHFNNGEKAVLDIMELLKIDPGYYMTKCYFFFSKKSNKRKTLKTKEPHMKNLICIVNDVLC